MIDKRTPQVVVGVLSSRVSASISAFATSGQLPMTAYGAKRTFGSGSCHSVLLSKERPVARYERLIVFALWLALVALAVAILFMWLDADWVPECC
jgi:hypothetical protein